MPSHPARAVLAQLRSLARDDGSRLAAAKDRLSAAEEEFTQARAEFDSASLRAEVSQRVATGAERLLRSSADGHTTPNEPPTGPGPQEQSRTIAEELLAFARSRQHVTRTQVMEHLGCTRPDIKLSGVSPELTRLVRAGELVRIRPGVYAIPPTAKAGDA